MLQIPDDIKIFVYFNPVDMRKAIDGLSILVETELEQSPQCGDLFIFRNRQANKVKILYWHRNGFVMHYKRLEKGRFQFPKSKMIESLTITQEQLTWLLMGFDFLLQKTSVPSHEIYHY